MALYWGNVELAECEWLSMLAPHVNDFFQRQDDSLVSDNCDLSTAKQCFLCD